MNAKHTPGPWTLQRLEERRNGYDWQTFAVRSPANVCLAVIGDVDRYESERIPANAKLMVAAPELLAACKAALSRPDWPVGTNKIKIQLQAAIAKAEGKD